MEHYIALLVDLLTPGNVAASHNQSRAAEATLRFKERSIFSL